jgi:hypothetical protein
MCFIFLKASEAAGAPAALSIFDNQIQLLNLT